MRKTFLLLMLGLWPGLAVAQDPPTNVLRSGSPSYQVRPGDVLQVTVWGQDDYTGLFQVDANGVLYYPGLGEVNTDGRTLGEIRDEIREGLGTLFNSPFVTVTPRFNIAVLGYVFRPGLFTVDPTQSVLDVVAMAGGPSEDGNINKIRLIREGDALNLSLTGGSGQSLQDVGILSGDQIFVPRRGFTRQDLLLVLTAAQLLLSVLILIQGFGV